MPAAREARVALGAIASCGLSSGLRLKTDGPWARGPM
jgi:hypothetical protein